MRITLITLLTVFLFTLPLYSEDLGVISAEVSSTNGDYVVGADVTLTLLLPGRDPCGGGGSGRGGDGDDGGSGGDDDRGGGCGGGGCGGNDCDCEDDCDGEDCDCGCHDGCGGGGCGGNDCDCEDDCDGEDCDCGCHDGCGGGGCGGNDCDCEDDCDGEDCDCGCHDGCGGRRGGGCGGGGCDDGDKEDGDCDCGCGNGCGGGCEGGCGCDCDKQTQTDDRGRFEFTCLTEGSYRLNIELDGMNPFEDVIYLESGDQIAFEVEMAGDNRLYADPVLQPENIELLDAYPNPFNSTATVSINLNRSELVLATLYNLNGQEVYTFHQGVLPIGQHRMTLNGADLSAGTYLIQVKTSSGINSQTINLIK